MVFHLSLLISQCVWHSLMYVRAVTVLCTHLLTLGKCSINTIVPPILCFDHTCVFFVLVSPLSAPRIYWRIFKVPPLISITWNVAMAHIVLPYYCSYLYCLDGFSIQVFGSDKIPHELNLTCVFQLNGVFSYSSVHDVFNWRVWWADFDVPYRF